MKISFISNLKKPACAFKRYLLELVNLRYWNSSRIFQISIQFVKHIKEICFTWRKKTETWRRKLHQAFFIILQLRFLISCHSKSFIFGVSTCTAKNLFISLLHHWTGVNPSVNSSKLHMYVVDLFKVRTFWEAHKIWKNLPHGFDVY